MGVTPPPWTGPAVGLMDLDAFFASVEMLDHPEWRGACARKPFGRTGTLIATAR